MGFGQLRGERIKVLVNSCILGLENVGMTLSTKLSAARTSEKLRSGDVQLASSKENFAWKYL